MTFSAKNNIYEVNARSVLDIYGSYIRATGGETLLAVSMEPLSARAEEALLKSAAGLGFGARALAFVALDSFDPESADGEMTLGPADTFALVEGLDPLSVIVADSQAASVFGHAFRVPVSLDAFSRAAGRAVVAFRSFDSMLDDPSEKQRAWALLKKIPGPRDRVRM